MKIIREKINRRGKREVTVELDTNDTLIAIRKNSHYKLGYPIQDIVSGHELAESTPVIWCSISQKWED